jgi:excisionase family DNA binding protein
MAELTASEVAESLGTSRQWVTTMLRRGDLTGRQLAGGTWLIDTDSLHEFRRMHHAGRGRNWTAPTSWSVLMLLSGRPVLTGTSTGTAERMRRRIAATPADEIARRVSGRVRWQRFTADDPAGLREAVALTGRSAAHLVDADLAEEASIVHGYALEGGISALLREHLLIPNAHGTVALAEVDESVPLPGPVAPPAVVAADLAASPATRERSAGLRALEKMRIEWLASATR